MTDTTDFAYIQRERQTDRESERERGGSLDRSEELPPSATMEAVGERGGGDRREKGEREDDAEEVSRGEAKKTQRKKGQREPGRTKGDKGPSKPINKGPGSVGFGGSFRLLGDLPPLSVHGGGGQNTKKKVREVRELATLY